MIWVAVLLGLYLAVLLCIAWFHLHPARIPLFLSPGALGAPQEDVEFSTPEGRRIRGWWVPAKPARAVAVFSHGYFMNRAEMVPIAVMLWKHGVSCLLFDFRAHGRSEGRKSTLGREERHDVAAAARWARGQAPGVPLVLVGSSMGCAASVFAVEDEPSIADAMVLDSAYSRLSSAIVGWWRFLGGRGLAFILSPVVVLAIPFAGFSPFKVDVAASLAKAGPKPTLFLHGDEDDLALPDEAMRNEAASPGPKRLVWFAKCGHSEARWVLPFQYQEALLGFLAEHGFIELPVDKSEPPLDTD